jgi:hypothetical protein
VVLREFWVKGYGNLGEKFVSGATKGCKTSHRERIRSLLDDPYMKRGISTSRSGFVQCPAATASKILAVGQRFSDHHIGYE